MDTILATTFTRKAAGEILHRVLERLAQASIDPAAAGELADQLSGVAVSQAACLAALRRVADQLHRMRIGTLDSYFAQVARVFSFEMGLPAGWTAMDPVAEPVAQMQAISQLLDNHDRKTLVALVRMLAKGESQRQVAQQIRETVQSGYAAFRVTNEEDWDQLPLPASPSESAVESALLTVANPGLSNKGALAQLQKLHLSASSGNWEAVIAHGVFTKMMDAEPSYYRCVLPAALVTALRILAERSAAELLPIRRNQTLASFKVLSAYDEEYSRMTRRLRTLAFSDVTYQVARWMGHTSGQLTLPSTLEGLGFRLDSNIRHLLLDEFQDTAPDQWRILEPMAKPLASSSRALSADGAIDRSFFCVGDAKQAIYGWRGGVAEIFDSVEKSLDGIAQQQLQQSFRSSLPVINVVNRVFQHLPQHDNYAGCQSVAQSWSRTFPTHTTARQDLSGFVRVQNCGRRDGELTAEENQFQRLEFAAQQIAALATESTASIGVLFRANADVARMISLLRQLGIPASQDGGNPLSDSSAVELILSTIHLADHPGDSACGFHVGTSPLAKRLPHDACHEPDQLSRWLRRESARRGIGSTIERLGTMLADKLSWWDQHRVRQLINLAYEFEKKTAARLRDFETYVLEHRVALPSEAQVKVMTIHGSKGLEFDAVFLPEMSIDLASSNQLLVLRGNDPSQPPDGVLRYMNASLQAMLPANWQQAFLRLKERSVRESLCLLYVAMTRARAALYITTQPNSHNAKQELGSILQSVLGDDESIKTPKAVLFQDGNENWFTISRHSAPAEGIGADAQDGESLKRSIVLRSDAASAPARGLRRTAPSTLQERAEPVSLAHAFSVSESHAAAYGTLIHFLFEQVHWLDDYRFDPPALRKAAFANLDADLLRHLNVEQSIQDFGGLLQLCSVRDALTRSRYRGEMFGRVPDHMEVENERAIHLIDGQRMISGTIDRLVLFFSDKKPYAAEIIDYKTDAYDPSVSLLWIEDRIAHHRPQLDAYCQVVSQLFGVPRSRIHANLLMLNADALVRCDAETSSIPNSRQQQHVDSKAL